MVVGLKCFGRIPVVSVLEMLAIITINAIIIAIVIVGVIISEGPLATPTSWDSLHWPSLLYRLLLVHRVEGTSRSLVRLLPFPPRITSSQAPEFPLTSPASALEPLHLLTPNLPSQPNPGTEMCPSGYITKRGQFPSLPLSVSLCLSGLVQLTLRRFYKSSWR